MGALCSFGSDEMTLESSERSLLRAVPIHAFQDATHFGDRVGPFSIWMKGKVPRAGAGNRTVKRRIVRRQLRGRRIKMKHHNAIQTKIVDEEILVFRRHSCAVSVRFFLTFGIDAVAFEKNVGNRLAEASAGKDFVARHAAAAVIGYEQGLASVIGRQVARG